MRNDSLAIKIRRRWLHLRLQPIPVFVFHSVSDVYNPLLWWDCDWTQTVQFKQNILHLKKQYTFISLNEAYDKLCRDTFRFRKYAVLTADDGYRSLLNILPWLEKQKIPITLFVNTKYLDNKSWSFINEEKARKVKPEVDMFKEVCPDLYLSFDELFALDSPWITIGLHGHEHSNAFKLSDCDFRDNVEKCKEILSSHPRYIPYFAYTWGNRNVMTDGILKEMNLIPVVVKGTKNYRFCDFVDRLCIDGKQL